MTEAKVGSDHKPAFKFGSNPMPDSHPIILAWLAGIALVGLGVLNFVYRDTLLSWQPVDWAPPAKTAVALLSGTLLILSGTAMWTRRGARGGAWAAAGWIGLWAIALHIPATVSAGFAVAALLGVAETTMIAIGLAAFAGGATRRTAPYLRIGAGVCCMVFGLSHFAYLDFTAQMVPSWVPLPLIVAGSTGTIHFMAGVMLVVGMRSRLAAFVEASMMASFVLLLHLPNVIASPASRIEWTMLAIAVLLSTSVAMLAAAQPRPIARS